MLSPPRCRLPLARMARFASALSSTRKRATSWLASHLLATTTLRRHAPNSSAFRGDLGLIGDTALTTAS